MLRQNYMSLGGGSRLRLPRTSVGNLCRELVKQRFLEEYPSGFTLGQRLAEFGAVYLQGVDAVRVFHIVTAELCSEDEDTLQLATLSSDLRHVIYLARHDGLSPIRLVSDIGTPLFSTTTGTGKAMLAQYDDARVSKAMPRSRALPTYTQHSLKDVASLISDLGVIRQRGYALDNEETTLGVVCVAVTVPTKSMSGQPYAISYSLLKAATNDDRLELALKKLQGLATAIASRAGERDAQALVGQGVLSPSQRGSSRRAVGGR
jgi:DNA-binding IclR family transcriptional regulator